MIFDSLNYSETRYASLNSTGSSSRAARLSCWGARLPSDSSRVSLFIRDSAVQSMGKLSGLELARLMCVVAPRRTMNMDSHCRKAHHALTNQPDLDQTGL